MLINEVREFERVLPDLLCCVDPVVDVETNGTNTFGTKAQDPHTICGIAVDVTKEAFYFPFRHLQGDNLPMKCMEFFKSYLSSPHRTYGGWNYKFDQHAMAADGIPYAPRYRDGMLGLHLLNENEPNYALKDTCDRYGIGDGSLQESILKDKVIADCKKLGIRVSEAKADPDYWKGKMWVLPAEDVEPYACDDVRLTRQMDILLTQALQGEGTYNIWVQNGYYSYIASQMENRGMLLDVELMAQYEEEAVTNLDNKLKELEEKAGYVLNPKSSKQVCAFLETESSAEQILKDMIAFDHPKAEEANIILEARGWQSVASRYYTPYKEIVDKNNVLHCNFNIHGTVTGRLSCTKPNLQQVAKASDVFKVKDVFITRPGYTMIQADYKQADMRIGCYHANEQNMAQLIRDGKDIHTETGNLVGIPRQAAKAINFGGLVKGK